RTSGVVLSGVARRQGFVAPAAWSFAQARVARAVSDVCRGGLLGKSELAREIHLHFPRPPSLPRRQEGVGSHVSGCLESPLRRALSEVDEAVKALQGIL